MSGLPKGWRERPLEELCDFNPKHSRDIPQSTNVSFVPMPAVDEIEGRIRSPETRPLSEVGKGFTHFQNEDVLFAKITPCMENGKAAVAQGLVNGVGCGSTEFHVLRSKGKIHPKYLWRFLRQKSFRQDAEQAMTGAVGQRRVPKEFLQKTIIPLPSPDEQRCIVAKLDSLAGRTTRARENLDRIPRLVQKYKRAMLAAALRGELTEEWRAKHKELIEPRRPNGRKTPLRRGIPETAAESEFVSTWKAPRGWLKGHVGKLLIDGLLIDVKDGNHGANHPKREEFGRSGLPFITAAQLESDVLDTATAPRLEGVPLQKLNVGFAKVHDVLLSHKGTVGRAAICTEECVLSPQTTYYRLNRSCMLPAFLRLQFLSPFFSRQLDDVKSQTTRDFVPISAQYELFLLQPSLDEQAEIVRRVETAFAWLDRVAAEHANASRLLPKLDQAILAKAFRGELISHSTISPLVSETRSRRATRLDEADGT
jgi:type I restriction enzyme S subunit